MFVRQLTDKKWTLNVDIYEDLKFSARYEVSMFPSTITYSVHGPFISVYRILVCGNILFLLSCYFNIFQNVMMSTVVTSF